jgi:hypothetical protein
MKKLATKIALEKKKAFVVKSRKANYRASLELEGFNLKKDLGSKNSHKKSIEDLLNKYRVVA